MKVKKKCIIKMSEEVVQIAAQMYFNNEDWKKYLEDVKKDAVKYIN